MGKTLVLNKEWRPVNIVPVLDAVMMVFNGRASFLDPEPGRLYDFESWVMEWDDAVRSAKIAAERVMPLAGSSLVLPEIVVCSNYRGLGYRMNHRRKPAFSRQNVYLRDRNICQFCGRKFRSDDMNMDHVIPKSKGGQTTWENIVLSCVPCNNRKKDHSLKESGMKLIRKPFQPTLADLKINPIEQLRMRIRSKPPKTWEAFLGEFYWKVELDKE
jgi:hypothetical protein